MTTCREISTVLIMAPEFMTNCTSCYTNQAACQCGPLDSLKQLTMHMGAPADKLRWLPASAETDVLIVDISGW